ncbi:cytochrome c oxidase assembly protein [Novosphingobium aquimarinum]|uniref:cytochrome c oxidase assembly protein n=1 Tax=Novosphingobium aquimarinum TaxID=2682494 RepID=UPI0012EB8C7D|nr:cytochrome c oxidase assembly protein [Novosphingobium aquimarinum]
MKRAALIGGLALVPLGWTLSGLGMTGHMAAHMIAVAVAAPLLAFACTRSRFDPASRWPRLVTPMAMMLVELATVWGWHLPLLRAWTATSILVAAVEQASFLAAGMLLWSAVLHTPSRAAGIGALLLTSMHMTLLGVLVGLAPRPLYGHAMHAASPLGLEALADQQLGGVVMLAIGAGSYLLGGLLLLGRLLRDPEKSAA